VLRCGVSSTRLDEPFLFLWTNGNDDFVRWKGRKSVADGETDVRLTGTSFDGLAGKLVSRVFSDVLGMTDRLLVVGEPVEHALPYDRHHDLDRLGLPDMRAQHVVRMFDRADDEDVLAHDGNVPPEDRRLQIDRLDVQVVDDRLMRIEAGELERVPEHRAGFRHRLLSRCGVDDARSTDAPVLADGAGAFYEFAFIDRFVDHRTDGGGDLIAQARRTQAGRRPDLD
jgi:hypothetical protein